jgi:hypothetical protein
MFEDSAISTWRREVVIFEIQIGDVKLNTFILNNSQARVLILWRGISGDEK